MWQKEIKKSDSKCYKTILYKSLTKKEKTKCKKQLILYFFCVIF